jgi:hypothetical protein
MVVIAGQQLSVAQAVQYAKNAGFVSNSLTYIVAIAIAESGLYTHAVNSSDPYGGSFGVLQINAAHFGETFGQSNQYVMSQSVAFDPALSFLFAYKLSNRGTKFTDWGTYTSGKYTTKIAEVQPYTGFGTPSSGTKNTPSPFPAYSGTPWYNYPRYSDADFGTGYYNTDVGTPLDTPITAPVGGTITYLGYFDWGGQVSWKVDNASVTLGVPEIFVIHLDAINPALKVGQHINAGTFLGYSGGELSVSGLPPLPNGLTHHATSSAHTTGPHLDIGVTDSPTASLDTNQAASNAVVDFAKAQQIPYGTGIGVDDVDQGSQPVVSSGGNFLPLGFSTNGDGGIGFSQLSEKVHSTLVQSPGMYGIAKALDQAEQFPGFYNDYKVTDIVNPVQAASDTIQSIFGTIVGNTIPFTIRFICIFVGFALLLMLLWQLAKPAVSALPTLLTAAGILA